MENVSTYKNKQLVFRKWARKNYAVFASLNKEVKIGHVDIEITEKASLKSKGKKTTSFINEKQTVDEEQDGIIELPFELLNDSIYTLLLFQQNLSDSSRKKNCISGFYFIKNLVQPIAGLALGSILKYICYDK